jgi:hypothetical protein
MLTGPKLRAVVNLLSDPLQSSAGTVGPESGPPVMTRTSSR